MLRALALVPVLVVFPVGKAAADAGPDQSGNAALKYWQAFATLPRLTEAEQTKLVTDCVTMPLDAPARDLVTKAAYSLRMLHQGAALGRCAWGLGWEEEGVGLLLPQADGARVLSALACLRARLRFEAGQNAEALDDLLAALTLGRHFAREGLNIMVLVRYGIEQRASDTLAMYLPRLTAETIQDLKTRLDALPPGGSAVTALPFEERSAVDWFVRKVKEAKDQDGLLALLGQFGETPARARTVLAECGGTAEGLLKYAEETRAGYHRMRKVLELPLDRFEAEWEAERQRQAGNSVFNLIFPAYDKMRWYQARAEVRRDLLAAGLAMRLEGREGLQKHPDPVVGGPFDYVAFEGGFELRSKLKLDARLRAKWKLDERGAQPLVLTVGRRGQ
jgi:hypothetical protein